MLSEDEDGDGTKLQARQKNIRYMIQRRDNILYDDNAVVIKNVALK